MFGSASWRRGAQLDQIEILKLHADPKRQARDDLVGDRGRGVDGEDLAGDGFVLAGPVHIIGFGHKAKGCGDAESEDRPVAHPQSIEARTDERISADIDLVGAWRRKLNVGIEHGEVRFGKHPGIARLRRQAPGGKGRGGRIPGDRSEARAAGRGAGKRHALEVGRLLNLKAPASAGEAEKATRTPMVGHTQTCEVRAEGRIRCPPNSGTTTRQFPHLNQKFSSAVPLSQSKSDPISPRAENLSRLCPNCHRWRPCGRVP